MAEHDTPRAEAPPSLKDAGWLKRPETVRVFAALSGDGIETRAVGGAVRDALLGLPVSEVDLATMAVPEDVMARARKVGLKAIPTGIAHGTVTVVADGVSFEDASYVTLGAIALQGVRIAEVRLGNPHADRLYRREKPRLETTV